MSNIKPPTKTPFADSYWVIQDIFLAGRHPQKTFFLQSNSLQSLLNAGITVFIDLSGGLDYSPDLTSLDTSQLAGPTQYHPFPITDYSTPDHEQMVDILDTIDQAIQSGKKVYVHCYAGHGRTGTVVGCFLARHGITGKTALEKISELRSGMGGSSPESDSQKEMVADWREGQ